MNGFQSQDQWRERSLVSEAVANVISPGSKLRRAAMAGIVLGLALVGFRFMELSSFQAQIDSLAMAGRNLVVLQGTTPERHPRISRGSCESLSATSGVLRSGPLVEISRNTFPQLGPSIPVFGSGPTLFPELSSSDAVVGAELIALKGGQRLNLVLNDQTFQSRIGKPLPSGIPVNSSVVVGLDANAKHVDRCYVFLDQRQEVSTASPALIARLHVHDQPVTATSVFPDSLDPYAQYRARPTAPLPNSIGAALGVLVAFTASLRSSELAAYRLSGTNALSLFRLLAYESIVVSGLFWMSGSLGLLFISELNFTERIGLLASLLAAAAVAVLVSMTFSVFQCRRSPMELSKDR